MDLTMQKSSLESERRLKVPWRNLVHPSIKCVPMLVTSWRHCIPKVVSTHVETVVLLSQLRQKPDDYIDVDVDVAELEGTSAETKATYEKIKKYVAEHNDGMKVSNLYIAQVKRKCGIELAENFNLPKSEDARQPRCPKEKEEAIVEALKAFQMI